MSRDASLSILGHSTRTRIDSKAISSRLTDAFTTHHDASLSILGHFTRTRIDSNHILPRLTDAFTTHHDASLSILGHFTRTRVDFNRILPRSTAFTPQGDDDGRYPTSMRARPAMDAHSSTRAMGALRSHDRAFAIIRALRLNASRARARVRQCAKESEGKMDATGDAARAALARTRARRERNERVDRGKENDVVDDDDDAKVDRERYVRVTTGDDANGRRRERRKELAMRCDGMESRC